MSFILHIEDDPGHAFLTERALQNTSPGYNVKLVTDGQQAVDYLTACKEESTPRPSLILLDLNLPKLHGLEVLRIIKKDASLCDLPVIILTTSDSEKDRRLCFELCADDFLVKSGDFSSLAESLQEKVGAFLGSNKH